ncbi:hypothetical protein D3C71_1559830 [compost metagenome]
MDALAQAHAAREVDVHAGRGPIELVQCVVGDHAAVAAQAFAERHIARRGEANDLDALPLCKLEGGAVGRFARCAGQQHALGAKELLVGQKIVDEPRGDEQRPQQCLHVLVVGAVQPVGAGAQIVVVHSVQARAVGCPVAEALGCGALGRQHGVAGHGPVAIQPLAHGDGRVGGLQHRAKPPHGHDAPAGFIGREELPVVQHVAQGGIGDVVGGQRKLLDPHAHLAVGKGGVFGG